MLSNYFNCLFPIFSIYIPNNTTFTFSSLLPFHSQVHTLLEITKIPVQTSLLTKSPSRTPHSFLHILQHFWAHQRGCSWNYATHTSKLNSYHFCLFFIHCYHIHIPPHKRSFYPFQPNWCYIHVHTTTQSLVFGKDWAFPPLYPLYHLRRRMQRTSLDPFFCTFSLPSTTRKNYETYTSSKHFQGRIFS